MMAYSKQQNKQTKKGQELTLLVKDIRYTHGKISRRFRTENRGDLDNPPDGPLLEETFEKLAKDPSGIMTFPKLLVMEQNDHYWAVNGNRRLFVYKTLDNFGLLEVYNNEITVWHVPFDSERFNRAFSNRFQGKSVQIHGIPNMQQYETKLRGIYLKNRQSGLQTQMINRNKNKLQTREVKELPVKDIRYTHQTISRRFRIDNRGDLGNAPDGPLLEETFEKLVKDPSFILSFPKIPVMECNGHFWAVNGNRRLFVYKMLDSFGLLEVYNGKITVSHVPFDAVWFTKSFTSHCEGKSVRIYGVTNMQEYENQLKSIYLQSRWKNLNQQPVKNSLTQPKVTSITKQPVKRVTSVTKQPVRKTATGTKIFVPNVTQQPESSWLNVMSLSQDEPSTSQMSGFSPTRNTLNTSTQCKLAQTPSSSGMSQTNSYKPSQSVTRNTNYQTPQSVTRNTNYQTPQSVTRNTNYQTPQSVTRNTNYQTPQSVTRNTNYQTPQSVTRNTNYQPPQGLTKPSNYEPPESLARKSNYEPPESVIRMPDYEPPQSVITFPSSTCDESFNGQRSTRSTKHTKTARSGEHTTCCSCSIL